MAALEEFEKKEVISSISQNISEVHLGVIKNEPALVLYSKLPFDAKKTEIEKNTVTIENDVYTKGVIETRDVVKYTIIHPATEKHIKKYREGKRQSIRESYELYREKVLPKAKAEGPSCQWIENIFKECEGQTAPVVTTMKEKVLFIDPEFIICPDLKWDERSISTIYLLAILRDPEIYTVRELTAAHVPLLRRIEEAAGVLLKSYGAGLKDVQIYFHYHPTFYRAHVHISSLSSFWHGTTAGSSVLLQNVIENLKRSSSYYREVEMEITLSTNSFLYPLYSDAQN